MRLSQMIWIYLRKSSFLLDSEDAELEKLQILGLAFVAGGLVLSRHVLQEKGDVPVQHPRKH